MRNLKQFFCSHNWNIISSYVDINRLTIKCVCKECGLEKNEIKLLGPRVKDVSDIPIMNSKHDVKSDCLES